MLTFDPVKHQYQYAGVTVPGVTQVLAPLANFAMVHPDVLAAAQQFGTAAHLACELDDIGKLDERSLDPSLAPYLAAWRKFSADYQAVWQGIELRVFNRQFGYAGTLDRVGTVKGQQAIVDIKSGTSLLPTVGPQLAAYAHAFDPVLARSVLRYAVRLHPDGYEVKQYTDPTDWPVFASLLTLRGFCTRHRINTIFQPTHQENERD